MAISTKLLRAHIKNRDLVNIRRENVDRNAMQGVVLDCSESLVLIQYVYDFRLDGYKILRRCDLSEVRCDLSDRFQKELLEAEGVFDQMESGFRVPIDSFESFLQTREDDEIIILAEESEDDSGFWIGSVAGMDSDAVEIRHFTSTGVIEEPLPWVVMDRITCCQIDTNYIRCYQRYFDRLRQEDGVRSASGLKPRRGEV